MYEKIVLDNGFRALLVPLRALHTVSISLFVRAGYLYERPEQKGISHFLEHMIFQGSAAHPDAGAITDAVVAMGADLNAITQPEYTEYTIDVHRDECSNALRLLADIILRPVCHPDTVDKEKAIVQNEALYSHDIDYYAATLLDSLVFDRPARELEIFGTRRFLRRLRRAELLRYHARHYVPANLVLCLCGRFDPKEATAEIARLFSDLKPRKPVPSPTVASSQTRVRSVFKPFRFPYVTITVGFRTVSYRDPNFIAALVANHVLGDGPTSLLYQQVREALGLAYDCYSYLHAIAAFAILAIRVTVSARQSARAFEQILRVVEDLRRSGINEGQLVATRKMVLYYMERLLDDPEGLKHWFGVQELLETPERLETPLDEIHRLDTVGLDAVNALAEQTFRPSNCSVVVCGPFGPQRRVQMRRVLRRFGT